MLRGSGSGVGVGTGTSGRCGVDFTKTTEGDAVGSGVFSGSGVPLDSADTMILAAAGSGVGVGVEFTKAAGGDVAGTAVALGSSGTTTLTAADSGVGVGVEFTKATGGVVPGTVVALDSGDTTILSGADSGVGAGVEFTKATRGVVPGTIGALDSGDMTMLSAVDSGVGVGVEVLTPGVETGLKDGAAVIKVLVTAEDFGAASTLVPALFLTQSSISGSKRSRSFARACSRSTAICVLTRPLSLDRFLLKLRISSAVSRSYIPPTIAGTRTVHNV
jgi:hypothetical protein